MGSSAKGTYPYEPDYAVPPGETLQETIDAVGMTQKELAIRAGLTAKTINRIIKGIDPISQQTAIRLERATGVPARMWNNLEMNYRAVRARAEDEKRLAANLEWLKQIPVATLVKWGLIEKRSDRLSTLQDVLAFFGVDSPDGWSNLWAGKLAPAWRRSHGFKMELGAVATWLRWGEREAQGIGCMPFSRDRFLAALHSIRDLTAEPPDLFQPQSVAHCANAGVAVVFVPEVPKCPAWGAAYWLTPDKALLQVSLRYKSDDHLWFSFFHEAGHILHDGKRDFTVDRDDADGESEKRANRFAADFLIPPDEARRLHMLSSEREIRAFARSIEIAPGIVVGRMQKEGIIPFSYHNKLKRRFQWEKK